MEVSDLSEHRNLYKEKAQLLGDYALLTKTELANIYCDYDEAPTETPAQKLCNESMRDAAFAALMLRYWNKISEWRYNSQSLHLEPVDFVGWLEYGLYIAFYYRQWRYPNKAKVKEGKFIDWERDDEGNFISNPYYWENDPNAPDKIINRCCWSIRGKEYQYYNKHKRRSNVLCYSLDSMVDENGDCALEYSGCCQNEADVNDAVYLLVSALLQKGEGIEALIIDGIARHDSFKERKVKYTSKEYDEELGEMVETEDVAIANNFDARKLVKHLNLVNQEFMLKFCTTYSIEKDFGDKIYEKLKSANNTKLYKYIKKTLLEVRNSPSLMECFA